LADLLEMNADTSVSTSNKKKSDKSGEKLDKLDKVYNEMKSKNKKLKKEIVEYKTENENLRSIFAEFQVEFKQNKKSEKLFEELTISDI